MDGVAKLVPAPPGLASVPSVTNAPVEPGSVPAANLTDYYALFADLGFTNLYGTDVTAERAIVKFPDQNPNPVFRIHWDGTDADGHLLGNGIYLYRLTVRVAGDESGQVFETIEKVAVVR